MAGTMTIRITVRALGMLKGEGNGITVVLFSVFSQFAGYVSIAFLVPIHPIVTVLFRGKGLGCFRCTIRMNYHLLHGLEEHSPFFHGDRSGTTYRLRSLDGNGFRAKD